MDRPRHRRCGRRGSAPGCRAARRRVEQAVVDGPGVDADARQPGTAAGRGEAGEDLAVQAGDVPAQVSVEADRPVREPVDLVEVERVLADPADARPARWTRRGRPRRRRGRARRARHRRNAAATPASTGMCSPVVWRSSPAVSAKTALATCSGSTSRLSRVRWA